MTKSEIVKEISARTGIDGKAVLAVLEGFMNEVKTSLGKEENVYLRGFGSFIVKKRAQKTARNISKNTTMIIPAHNIPIDQLKIRPQHLLIDGNRFNKYADIPHTTIVKGDGKYLSIAAASILAKTYRDDYMNRLAEEYPAYDWKSNKGYPTVKHREAIKKWGVTPYHRMSFNLTGDGQLSFDF